MQKMKPFDPRALVHTPAEMLDGLVKWAEDIQENPGITFGIPAIDKKVIPLRPGNLACFIARPGHAKTSVLVYLAREEGKKILARGAGEKEAVVFVSWEQTCEEICAMLLASPEVSNTDIAWGRADTNKIKRIAIKNAKMPIWIIGHGISRAGLDVPRMTPDIVLQAIESMEKDFGVKPTMMLFDYLQLIPTNTAKERVAQVTEMPIRLKELAMRVGSPAVAAVQASRDVDKMETPIPEISHAQWASSIEQTADRVFALWRPSQIKEEGEHIELGNEVFIVNENLLIIRLLKQRGDRGRATWGMHFDPALMRLADLERVDLEEAAYQDRQPKSQKINYNTGEEPHKPITF